MWPIKKKIDGYWVEGHWMPTKEIMAMYPDEKQRARLAMRYEPKEEVMPIVSLAVLLVAGCAAFAILGALAWELHTMGLF